MGNEQTKSRQSDNKVKKIVQKAMTGCEYIDSTQPKINKIVSLWLRKNDMTKNAPLDDLATIIALFACKDPDLIWRAIERHDLKICRLMMSINPLIVNTSVTNDNGRLTLFQHSVRNGTASIVEAFIDSGHLSTKFHNGNDQSNFDLIHSAIDGEYEKLNKGAAKMIELLVNKLHLNVNARDENSVTPLMRATWLGLPNIVKTLINPLLNADVSLLSSDNESILYLACEEGHSEILSTFLNDEKIREKLDVNGRTKARGHTPLMFAACHGHSECVSLLLKKETIDLSLTANSGWNALIHAVDQGHFEIVKMIAKHAKRTLERHVLAKMVNARIKATGSTTLHLACERKYTHIASYLMAELSEWIDVSIEDKLERTPLMIAQSNGFGDIFQIYANIFEIFIKTMTGKKIVIRVNKTEEKYPHPI